MAETTAGSQERHEGEGTRRDFLYLVTGATAAVGVGAVVWPLIDSMNPAANVLALATVEVNLTGIEQGMAITVTWRGKPVFVRHRTEQDITAARDVDVAALRDPQTDEIRAEKPEWLVVVGVCTHLGCVPLGNRQGEPKGDFNGWFCPCHGSHYDTSGRIRIGPAPLNLAVPPYIYNSDTVITIG